MEKNFRTIWFENNIVKIIDQTKSASIYYHDLKILKTLSMQLRQWK